MPEPKSPYRRVRKAYRQTALKKVCEMPEADFGDAYGLDLYTIAERNGVDDFFFYKNNGSNILAVAHLDTVADPHTRTANFVNTAAGPIVFSRALDDRLGAYTILELLPALGIQYDILLTVGEEGGRSTAAFFDSPEGREYNWMIEFDRGGTDCVMYQYDDFDLRERVRDSGAKPAHGAFSDISYLEHLAIKGVNWGVGYRDYHGPRAHAYLNDYWQMIGDYLKFHEANVDEYLPHVPKPKYSTVVGSRSGKTSGKTSNYYGSYHGESTAGWAGWRGDEGWDPEDETADDTALDTQWLEENYPGLVAAMKEGDEDDEAMEKDLDDIVSEDFVVVNDALLADIAAAEAQEAIDKAEASSKKGDVVADISMTQKQLTAAE